MKLKTTSLAALAAFTLAGPASAAATVLYSENFNGEGTAVDAYNLGTTPEINVGSISTLQSTGANQGGNGTNTAWQLANGGIGNNGLRFGSEGGYNWATGLNASDILTAGGFSISFDYTVGDGGNWMAVRVGSGPENDAVNDSDTTFAAMAQGDGHIQTYENGTQAEFGTAGANVTRNAQFNYKFNSWNAGTTVNFTGIIDGNLVATDTFTWDVTNDMKIIFTGYQAPSTGVNTMDNIVITTIPEPTAALLGGLGMLALLRRRRA